MVGPALRWLRYAAERYAPAPPRWCGVATRAHRDGYSRRRYRLHEGFDFSECFHGVLVKRSAAIAKPAERGPHENMLQFSRLVTKAF